MQRWSTGVMRSLGVEVRASGATAAEGMLVANHISWLDVIAIASVRPAVFVAKDDIRRWPFFGRLAEGTGTIFIARRRPRDLLRVNALIACRLRDRESVVVFPEGTTTDGSTLLPFRGALLQPAVNAGVDVHPVAISYRDRQDRPVQDAAYCNDMTLWDSLRLVACARGLAVHVAFLDPIAAAGVDRRAVAAAARRSIEVELPEAPFTRGASKAGRRGSRRLPPRFRTGWLPSARRR